MDSLQRMEGAYMGRYLVLFGAAHKALRQLGFGSSDEAKAILNEALAQVESTALIVGGHEVDSADISEFFNEMAEKNLGGEREKAEPETKMSTTPLEFYKKQYAELLFALDEVISRMRQGDYEGARLHAITTLGEAEEAYIQADIFDE